MENLPDHILAKLRAKTITDDDIKGLLANYYGQERKELKKLFYTSGQSFSSGEMATTAVNDDLEPKRRILKSIFINKEELTEKDKNDRMTEECKRLFEEMDNPFAEVMTYYRGFPDISRPSVFTLSGIFLQKFSEWIKSNPKVEVLQNRFLSEEFRTDALKQLMKHHTVHLSLANSAYRFSFKEIKELAIPRIEEYVREKKYHLALEYSLHARVPTDPGLFLIARLLEVDGFEEVKAYCKVFQKHQKEIVQVLNTLLLKEEKGDAYLGLLKYMEDRYGTEFVQEAISRMDTKLVKKYLKSIISAFDLESLERKLAPEYWWYIREEQLIYVKKCYFEDNKLDYYSYVTKTLMCLRDVEHRTKMDYVKRLWESRRREEAEQAFIWMMIFGLDDHEIPKRMLDELNNNKSKREEYHKKAVEIHPHDDIYNLSAEGKRINMIENEEQFKDVIMNILSNKNTFGIDVETVDEIYYPNKMVLFQLAVDSDIYIFDFISLDSNIRKDTREAFFTKLIKGDGLKLGFDFANDLLNISQKYHTDYKENNKNCLDLKDLIQNILEKHPDFIENLSEEERLKSFSLNDACEKILGKALDKSMQQSNWAARPLLVKQIKYAAVDAEILIQLYNAIKARAAEKNIDLAPFEVISMSDSVKDNRNKPTKRKILDMSWSEIVDTLNDPELDPTESKAIHAYKFAVAQHLDLLGYNLRRCGFDVVTCPKGQPQLDKVGATDIKRILCCSGKEVKLLRANFGPSRVWEFGTTTDFLLLTKNAIQRAKVKLNKKDIFTRCMDCNNTSLIIAPMPVVRALHHRHVVFKDDTYDEIFDVKDWKQKLREIDPQQYGGVETIVEEGENSFTVSVKNGRLDILTNEILGMGKSLHIAVKKIPDDVLIDGRLFYICSHCGKIHYDKKSKI